LEGSSEYRLNNRVVTYKNYNDALQRENILVQAKNFLVFQGDVEAIASQSPKDLTKLIERISGSLELAKEYEEAKKAQDKATESSTFNFTKRRGIMAEIKQFKEQKTEADKFEKLLDDRVRLL
jgi:structural maintenance of chromosome 1